MMMIAMHTPVDGLAWLLFTALVLYVVSSIAAALRKTTIAWGLLAAGGGCALAGWIWRGIQTGDFATGHAPLQNMYEVFLLMGWGIAPLAALFRWGLRVRGAWIDALLGALVLFPAVFVFDPDKQYLMPALQSPLFIPHVVVYLLGYLIIVRAAFSAMGVMVHGTADLADFAAVRDGLRTRQDSMRALLRLGFPLMTLGMLLGALWAQQAFGDWWSWDPKEQWSLTTWLILAAALHVPFAPWGKFRRLMASLVLLAVVAMIVTLLWSQISNALVEAGYLDPQNSYHTYSTKK